MKTNEEIIQIVNDLIRRKYLYELATEELFNDIKHDLSTLLENEIKLTYYDKFGVHVTTDEGILTIEF